LLGTACKFLGVDGFKVLTVANARKGDSAAQIDSIVRHNLGILRRDIKHIGSKVPMLRMFRIGSDLLPLYTHEDYCGVYVELMPMIERELAQIGQIARSLGVRLSMHPDQFVVLASDRAEVVERSVLEFEYHADIIRMLGYGVRFQDFKCNIHIGGRGGPDMLRRVYSTLSDVARNTITVENQEYTWGLEHTLELADIIPTVLDIHHHWIYTRGEYIQPTDSRVQRVLASWRGVGPTIHYSMSRRELVPAGYFDYADLTATSAQLRAHSDDYYSDWHNCWALSFHEIADIMCEAKNKDVAVQQLYEAFQ
jgi:UV DNA damage endonuclease